MLYIYVYVMKRLIMCRAGRKTLLTQCASMLETAKWCNYCHGSSTAQCLLVVS